MPLFKLIMPGEGRADIFFSVTFLWFFGYDGFALCFVPDSG